MLPFNRTKTRKRFFISAGIILCLLLTANNNYAQVSISGPTSVSLNTSYTYYPAYNGSSTVTYNGWYTWTISGGYESSTGNTSKSGTCSSVLYSIGINVTWTSASGMLTFQSNLGSSSITVTGLQPLAGGSITNSPNYGSVLINTNPGFTITASAATGGSCGGSYSYQWQLSTDGVNYGDIINNAIGQNYSPEPITTTTYYRRKVMCNGTTEYTSNTYTLYAKYPVYIIGVTNCVVSGQTYHYTTGGSWSVSDNFQWCVSGGTIVSGSGGCRSGTPLPSIDVVWSGSASQISLAVTGFSTATNSVTALTSNNINITTGPLNVLVGSSVNTTLTSVSSMPSCPSSSYQWLKSTNGASYTNTGITTENYTISQTASQNEWYYRKIFQDGVEVASSNIFQLIVYPHLTAPVITAPFSPINYNTSSGTITESTGSTGGLCGSYSYEWQSSTDNFSTGPTIINSNTPSYSPGNLTAPITYYRRKTTCGSEWNYSNVVSISVFPQLLGGSISPSNQSVNFNATPTTLTLSGVSGGNGSYSYQWQSSSTSSFSSATNVGTNSTSYTPPSNVAGTLYYRVLVTSNGVTVASGTATVMVYSPLQGGSISPANQNVDQNGTPTILTLSTMSGGDGNYSYQWQSSASSNFSSPVNVGTNNTTYAPSTGTTETLYYRVLVTSNGVTVASATATVNVCSAPAGAITGLTTVIVGSATQLSNAASGGSWSSSNQSIVKVDANGVITGVAPGAATITYSVFNSCSNSSTQLGITVIPFTDLSSSLGKGIDDNPKFDTIALTQGNVRSLEFIQDTLYSLAHTITNVLALRVIEETDKYIPGDFSATAVLKVEYGHSSAEINQIDSIKLTVNYTKNAGNKYNALNYFTFKNAEFTRITVLRVEAPTTVNGNSFDTKQVIQLINTLAATRYYKLSDNKKPVLSYTTPPTSPVPDELPVSWAFPQHSNHNAAQLEWVWLENEMSGSYITNNVFDTALLFKTTSTRIDLPGGYSAGNYNIPLLYDGVGKLFMRIRGVNIMPAGSRSDGPWSGVQTYAFNGHNNNLNWQVTTTYAEEGKRKSVIQYFDGSLRPRQTVTKDNTTGQTVVAETLYDLEGRPAVQILPAPDTDNKIRFKPGFNLFKGNNTLNQPNDQTLADDPANWFDMQPVNTITSITAEFLTTTGTSQYYSSSNPDANSGINKYIPDAKGYPYTVTRYTPDATGRIMIQSGVGDSLAMGSGHETRYYYGTPSQEELDGLFGTEVGNYTHYFKNMVQDANGQMSINYVDMHGRTIATALAGDSPTNLQALNINDTIQYKNQAPKILTRNLLDKGSNILKGNSIESINTVLVSFKTNYSFNYQLPKQTLTLPKCGGGMVSYDCKFDLQVSVTDESGDSNPVVYNYVGIDNINFNQSLLLNAGSYSVRKSLTINQDSLDKFIAQYNTSGIGLCQTQQFLIDSIAAQDSLVSGCGVTPNPLTSSNCLSSLGTYSTYLSNYATSLGYTSVIQLSAAQVNDIRNQYIADSSLCATLNSNVSYSLDNIRRQMLADMVPYSGQYAKDTGTMSMAMKYRIFSTSGNPTYAQPFYKYPRNEALATDNYYTGFGNIDSSVLSSRLQTMTMQDFNQEFKESWTRSLLPYHPEFKKLKFAEDSLSSSFNYIDSIQYVTSAFNPITSDPFFGIPSRAADKDTIIRYSNVAWTGVNNYSMWQLAYGDAFGCKTIADASIRNTCYNNMPAVFTTTGTVVNTGSGSVTLNASIQSQAWNMFKGFYSQVRGEMVTRYINVRPGTIDTTDNRTLINEGFRIYFPYSYIQSAQNNGWTTWYPGANGGTSSNVNLSDSVKLYSSHCDSYINSWRLALLDCPALAAKDQTTREAILNSITSKMMVICKNGTDGANPYGSSTVAPAFSGSTFTSFEQAIKYVLDSAGIARDQYCHPYSIEWPKPYGKNPTITKQYVGVLDTCTCTQWNKLQAEINAAEYNSSSLTSVNQYLLNKYQDTITSALFNSLQQCGNYYLYGCRDTVISNCGHPGAYYSCTIQVCDTFYTLPLLSPQPFPAFLNCGFDSSSYKCYTCSDFTILQDSFYTVFGKYPVFTGSIPDSMIVWNDLFAKYINYKTGLQHNWQYYAERFNTYSCGIGGISGSGSGLSICLDKKPLNDTTGLFTPISPCQQSHNNSIVKGAAMFEYLQQQLLANFNQAYLDKCLAAPEQFSVTDTLKEYHYTLYYYDQTGSLVKTVPPKGVRPDYSTSFLNAVKTERDKMINNQPWTSTVPQHVLTTKYCYNSLNQVVIQKSPDGGVSKFWYDRLGRLAISQNAKQTTSNRYSYTLYDSLGRITEVGQLTSSTVITDVIAKSASSLQTWFNNVASSRNQVTQTQYDLEYGPINGVLLSQKNLRNRVSYTQIINNIADTYPASATYYTYDMHGNVDTLLQDFGNSSGVVNAMNQSGNRFKKIVYDYDLISGKVNQVGYQPGQVDAYFHRYVYDAENRLTNVYSARDSVMLLLFPEREARYTYYKHGPLARTDLGQLRVQGLDYAYSLQGWLKAVNPAMGGTLTNGTDTTEVYPTAQDAFAFSLQYFKNDYKAIGYTPQSTSVLGALGTNAAPLFNGNIAAMVVNIPKLGNTKAYNYHYDQLNRIVALDVFNGMTPSAGTFTPVSVSDYRERISYDPNGNILTYDRHGDLARLSMDSLSYYYKANTNQLHKVTDAATDASPADYSKYNDIKQGQTDNNYQYDEIGNLVKDNSEGITDISWNVYGKILSITKSGAVIRYVYDASGNRIMKQTAIDTTIYVRDASGNVMSVYTKPAGGALAQTEMHLYGSSRLGMATQHLAPDTTVVLSGGFGSGIKSIFARGEKLFELSNHLGNVLVTVNDRKIQVSAVGVTVDSYTADIITANDYYPFGMAMPGRKYEAISGYRYGFNGKENDNDVKGEGNQIDYGKRVYDPRIGKFLSTDPLTSQFPYYTPYQYAGNKPIWAMDLDGAEELILPRGITIPDPILTLPRLGPMPVPPINPPVPPLIPQGFSMPQTPTLPPAPYMPVPPMSPSITRSTPIDESGINPNDATTYPTPPFAGEWKVTPIKPGTKGFEKLKEKGATRLENEKGDILRWHEADEWHPKGHWDLKRGGSPNNKWENWTPDGTQIPDGQIYGKDFNPAVMMFTDFSTFPPTQYPAYLQKQYQNLRKQQIEYNKKKVEYDIQKQEYDKQMKKYEKKLKEYNKKMDQYYKDHPELIV
jgi:RHS repeat-associated protein